MKLSNLLFVMTFLVFVSSAYSQEIPKGVNYKRAGEAVNTLAKVNLERAPVSSEAVPADFFGEVVVVGPLVWKALKPSADQILALLSKSLRQVWKLVPVLASDREYLLFLKVKACPRS